MCQVVTLELPCKPPLNKLDHISVLLNFFKSEYIHGVLILKLVILIKIMSRYKSVKLQMLTWKHILAQVLTQHQHVLLKQPCCFLLLPLGPQCRAYTVCQCCLSLSLITMGSTPLLPHCRLSVSTCATIFIYKNILAPL